MDFSKIAENLPLIAMVIGLIVMQIFLKRRRKPETTQTAIAQSLLSELKLDRALAENFSAQPRLKKFEMVSWQLNGAKIGFLGEPLQRAISDTYAIIEDFNRQIDSAKKQKSTVYLVNVDAGKLKGPMSRSVQGLEEWLQSTTGAKEASPKYPGMLDGMFGGR